MANAFADLYRYCQDLKPKVSRKDLEPKTLELTSKKIRVVKTSLDTRKCRGFFLSANNENHRLVQQLGSTVIVLARDLNYCWERFVYTKELMHCFDSGEEFTDTAESFDKMLAELVHPQLEHSPPVDSEFKAFWMALACLCPEKYRLEYKAQLERGHMDNYSIALQLRIPEQYVSSLFVPRYLPIVKQITGQ